MEGEKVLETFSSSLTFPFLVDFASSLSSQTILLMFLGFLSLYSWGS